METLSESSKVYFHSKAFSFIFREIHVLTFFPPISLSSHGDENHNKVTKINNRQTKPFYSLDSSAHVAEGPVDLLVILKAS